MLGYSVAKYLVSCCGGARAFGLDDRDDRDATAAASPLLSLVIAGSSQLVIWLVKILASVSPDRRRFSTCLPSNLIWYGNDVPPAATGR